MEIGKLLEETQSTLPKRLQTLTKYFPYFEVAKLNSSSDKFNEYDLGGLCIAIIAFILYEGHLQDKGLTFEEIQDFVKLFIDSTYETVLPNEEVLELTRYILQKMQNRGEFFLMEFYNPISKKKEKTKTKYIAFEPDIRRNLNLYRLTADGIDFFLQTKEFEEESKVTIHLLLLKQLVKNGDYQTALQTLSNINIEVKKEERNAQEIVEELTMGYTSKYNAFQERVEKRFSEEQILFKDTMQSIETYQEEYLAEIDESQETQETLEFQRFVYSLKDELSKTTHIHSKILGVSTELAKRKEEILKQRRKTMFKGSLDFTQVLEKITRYDNVNSLESILSPLMLPCLHKSFSTDRIQELLTLRRQKVKEDLVDPYSDELVESKPTLNEQIKTRLHANLTFYLRELFILLLEKREITLQEYVTHLQEKFGEISLNNPDIITFIISMSRQSGTSKLKRFYYKDMQEVKSKPYKIEGVYLELIEEMAFKPLKKQAICVGLRQNEIVRINYTDITAFTYTLEGGRI